MLRMYQQDQEHAEGMTLNGIRLTDQLGNNALLNPE